MWTLKLGRGWVALHTPDIPVKAEWQGVNLAGARPCVDLIERPKVVVQVDRRGVRVAWGLRTGVLELDEPLHRRVWCWAPLARS